MTQSPAELPSLLERTVADVCFLNLHLHQSGMCSSLATPPRARLWRSGHSSPHHPSRLCGSGAAPYIVCGGTGVAPSGVPGVLASSPLQELHSLFPDPFCLFFLFTFLLSQSGASGGFSTPQSVLQLKVHRSRSEAGEQQDRRQQVHLVNF